MEEKICHWGTEILLNERDAEVGVGEDEIGVSKNQPVMWTGDFFLIMWMLVYLRFIIMN